jgi:predicted enzyme related to lactoylglutathione lyase
MSLDLAAVSMAARDPELLASFWSEVLGWQRTDDHHGRDEVPALLPHDDTGFRLRFTATDEPRTGLGRVHFDLTSATDQAQRATVARALDHGGTHLDVGQGPDADHVVLGDPEGNEFCVIESWNHFLAGCPSIGALSGDGSQAVGYFWSAALEWPLVWDQDEETAIQAPYGGSKLTWGGPPYAAKRGRNRLHLDLTPMGTTLAAEADRLVSLGATVLREEDGRIELADPDGNELCLLD